MDRSTAGQRILGSRTKLLGSNESLETIIATALTDGAICFVTDEGANYRYYANSELPQSLPYVVVPSIKHGRWIREGGSVGFAILWGNGERVAHEGEAPLHTDLCRSFKSEAPVVQFEMDNTGVKYVGPHPRLALTLLSAVTKVDRGGGVIELGQMKAPFTGEPQRPSICGVRLLAPGDRVQPKITVVPGTAMRATDVNFSIVLL